jgi:hypothetical protein
MGRAVKKSYQVSSREALAKTMFMSSNLSTSPLTGSNIRRGTKDLTLRLKTTPLLVEEAFLSEDPILMRLKDAPV